MRRLPLLLASLVVVAAAPGAGVAVAQDPTGVTVFDGDRGEICVAETYEEVCGDPLVRDDDAALIAEGAEGNEVIGVVPAAAATVELRSGPGTVTVTAGPPAGYRGRFAGKVAVFRARHPGRAGLLDRGVDVYVRDAAGRLIGVAPGQDRPDIRTDPLHRFRLGGETFAVDRHRQQLLRPTVLDLAHLEESDCLTSDAGFEGFRLCFEQPPEPVELHETRTCNGRVVIALTSSDTTVVLVRADGRRVTARRAPFDAQRTVSAFGVPATMALRRIELTREGTTTVAGFGIAPPRFDCDAGGSIFGSVRSGPVPPETGVTGERTLLAHQGHRLRTANDAAGRLCLAVDDEPFPANTCRDPDRTPALVRLAGRRLPDGSAVVAGIVRASTPAVRVRTDKATRRVATVALPDEAAGPYAGLLRGVVFRVPAGAAFVGAQALDAAGRVIDEDEFSSVGFDDPQTPFAPRGVRRLGHGRWAYRIGDVGCVAATPGRRPQQDDPASCLVRGEADAVPVTVVVRCADRRPVVLAVARGRTTRIAVTTADGRVRRAAAHALGGGLHGHAVALPATAVPRAVRIEGDGRRRVEKPLRMASGRAQCGYDGFALADRSPRR